LRRLDRKLQSVLIAQNKTYAATPQQPSGYAQDQPGWDAPRAEFRDVQRQGFHDGIEGAAITRQFYGVCHRRIVRGAGTVCGLERFEPDRLMPVARTLAPAPPALKNQQSAVELEVEPCNGNARTDGHQG